MPGLEWGWTLASWPLVRAFVAVAEASSRSNSGRPVSGKSPSAGGRLVEWLRGWRRYPSAVLGTVGFCHGGLVVGRGHRRMESRQQRHLSIPGEETNTNVERFVMPNDDESISLL